MSLILLLSLALAAQPVELGTFEDQPAPGVEAWTFSPGAEFPGARGELAVTPDAAHEGQRGAELRYDFSGGGNYVAAYVAFEPQDLARVTLWVRKPADASLTFRLTDSTGQTLQKPLTWAHDGWQQVAVDLGTWGFSWGGANDRVVHFPVRQFGLLVEKRGLRSLAGVVQFDQVLAETGRPEEVRGTVDSRYRAAQPAPQGWRYRLAGGQRTATLGLGPSLLGRPTALTVRARGGLAGQKLRLRLGSHFQQFERELGTLTGEPVEFTVPVPPENGWSHFGGPNDGQVRWPLRLNALLVDRGDAAEGEAKLEGIEVWATVPVGRNQAVTLIPRGGAQDAGGLTFPVQAVNLLPKPLTGTVRRRVSDWQGRVLADSREAVTLPAGELVDVSARLPEAPADLAMAEATVSFEAAGQQPQTVTSAYAAEVPAPAIVAPQPDSPWGMGLYLYRYANNEDGFRDMARAAGLGAAAGVKWSREEFQWGRLEPRRGEYEWSFYDRMVDTAERRGISVYGLLAYWSPWTKPYTEEGIDDYCRWAAAVVSRYKGRINHWEVWNEPNIFFWSGPKELYPVLLTRAYAAIKAANPDARVLGCSTAGIDTAFIRRCLDAGAPFDILTIHPYRATLDDAAFVRELRETKELVGGRPVWITEMGWPTQLGGTAERDQAALLARCYLDAVASGACDNISWYDFRNDGDDPFYNEANFGVVRRDFRPKPAYRALATVAGGLPRTRDPQILDWGEGVTAYRFATDRGPVHALWSRETRLLALQAPAGAETVDLMGNPAPLPASGWLLLPAGTPVLVRGAERLERAGEPVRVTLGTGGRAGDAVPMRLEFQGLEAPVRWSLEAPAGWEAPSGTAAPGAAPTEVVVPLPAEAAGSYPLTLRLELGGQTLAWPLRVEVTPEVLEG